MPEPVSHKTIDLIARVDEKEYALAQAKVPVYANFDPNAEDLRGSVTFTVGDPVVAGLEGHGAKAQQARALLGQWKRKVEAELNHPAGTATTTP